MFNSRKFLAIFLSLFGVLNIANANECATYKIKPKIVINIPQWNKSVIQPHESMDLLHGNVVATLVDNYDINTDITSIEDGFCISLKSVYSTIGYSDFLVKIDKRHNKNSCSYNAILNHENKHIDAYLSVIDDYKTDLHNALYSAADSVMPIFIKDTSEIDWAIEKLNNELQSHPNIVLIKQKIHAAEEIKNKNIDIIEDYSELKKCLK